MDRIFLYTDRENDSVHVWDESPEDLVIKNIPDHGGTAAVRLDRDAVLRLHTALGKWISGDDTPVYGADTLYGQLIQQAVAAEVARVLPLHLSPVATCRVGACDAARHLAEPVCTVPEHAALVTAATLPYGGQCPGCTPMGCTDPSHAGPAEPEPHDVGHPTYEDARPLVRVGPSHCGECTHSMKDHIALGGCWGSNGTCECGLLPKDPVPVVESDKVWGDAGQPPVACTCNPTAFHPHDTNGCMHPSCTCKWVRG